MLKLKIKIFNLSFPRTGTSSFISLMKNLGYKTKHWDKNICDLFLNKNYEKIYDITEQYEVFADFPWPLMYKELENKFYAKFILFERPKEEWISSCLNYFNPKDVKFSGGKEIRKHVFLSSFPADNEKKYIETYENHNNNVKKFFNNKKNFINIKLGNKIDWDIACNFLQISNLQFPKLNQS